MSRRDDKLTHYQGEMLDTNPFALGPAVLRAVLAISIAFVALAIDPLQVAAECDGPVPSFRHALATANRVVIGDVVAVRDGGLLQPPASTRASSRFTLRVRYTVVGDAPRTMEIRDLLTQPCAGVVQARVGDRIALAFNATDFSPPMQVNTVAWIRGTRWDAIGVETVTVVEVFRLLGLAPPNTATLPEPPGPGLPVGLFVALAAGALGGGLAWRRSRPTR